MGNFLRDCPHCPANHSTFSLQWARRNRDIWNVAATCGACSSAVIAEVTGPNVINPCDANGNIEQISYPIPGTSRRESFKVRLSWPSRNSAEAPPHTPAGAAARFRDGEFNFQNGRWNAAVGMYRAALDLATKALQAQGNTFYARTVWLHDQGRLTRDLKDWADHVRVEGNDALHDPEEFTEDDAKALRHFTTMFLRYVFEMPGMVAEFRQADAPA